MRRWFVIGLILLLGVRACPLARGSDEDRVAGAESWTPLGASLQGPTVREGAPSTAGDAAPSLTVGPLLRPSATAFRGVENSAPATLLPRTWGFASFDVLPVGQKMAPNGLPYDPLFTLGILVNVALTPERALYVFGKSRFWAQKSAEGITNSNQGSFDFSKRQFDLDAGIAWNFWGPLEARAFLYSDNNLNRGWWLDKPTGFKDGYGLECRCYLPGTDFDRGLYRYVAAGYFPTKTQVGGDGKDFSPGFYAAASVAWDVDPRRLYGYLEGEYVSKQGFVPKLLVIDPGVAWRPWERYDAFELRLGVESTIDVDVGYTRAFLYGTVRVVW